MDAKDEAKWLELQRKRALTILAIFRINRQIEEFRSSLESGGVKPTGCLPLDGYTTKLFGAYATAGVTGHWAKEFMRDAVKSGAVDAREVESLI